MRLVFGFRRYLLCVTLLLALPVAAKADFVITLTDVNTGTSETINGTNNSFSGSGPSTFINATPTSIVYFPLPTGFGNFSGVSVTISTNSPGSSAMGQVSETVNGTNTSGSADTLMLSVISTGFTAPGSGGSSVNLFSKLGNTAQGTASLTSSLVDGGGTVATTPTVTGSGTSSAHQYHSSKRLHADEFVYDYAGWWAERVHVGHNQPHSCCFGARASELGIAGQRSRVHGVRWAAFHSPPSAAA